MILWTHPGHGERHAAVEAFIARRALGPAEVLPINGASIVVVRDGEIRAAVCFTNWQPAYGTVELSGAGDGLWMSRGVMAEMADYVFRQLGCHTAVMRSDEGNTRVERIARKAGFKRFVVPDLRGPGKAEAIYTLSAATWRAGRFAKEN